MAFRLLEFRVFADSELGFRALGFRVGGSGLED